MIKVTFGNQLFAGSQSSFELSMHAVPLVGESIYVHEELIPSCYFQLKPAIYIADNVALLKVLRVEHWLSAQGHEIKVDFDFEDEDD